MSKSESLIVKLQEQLKAASAKEVALNDKSAKNLETLKSEMDSQIALLTTERNRLTTELEVEIAFDFLRSLLLGKR